MESSIKINSISIDLAADEINSGKCQHFSIRGFVAGIREKDHRKCWPFSEDSVELCNHQSYSLPSLSVLKSRWWRCASCVRDINDNEINDIECRLQSHSRSIKEKKLKAAGSSAIPSKRKKEKKNNDQTAKKVRRRGKDGSSTVKRKSIKLFSAEQVSKGSKEKANVSTEISLKDHSQDQAVNVSSEIAGVVDDTPNKAIKKNHRNSSRVSTELDECDNVSSESRDLLSQNCRKTRKVRLLSELLLSNRNVETLSKKESVRGRKRKYCGDEEMANYASRILSTIGKPSENASKSCDSEDNNNNNTVSGAESRLSQSTDSGFDPIKGKQRNKRFQVVEERFPDTSLNDPYDYASPVRSSFPDKELPPGPLHTQRTEKEVSLVKKRKRKAITDSKKSTIITFSNNVDDGNLVKSRNPDHFPQAGPRDTLPQSTRDFLNSKWLDSSFDKLSVSDGHFNKYTTQLYDRPVFPSPLQGKTQSHNDDRGMMKGIGKNYFRDFGSSFKSSNADASTGVNIDFSSNINVTRPSTSLNDKLVIRTSSTRVAGSSCALQKDISAAHDKGKELSGAPRIQSMTSEHIDDIPMEIVELLARNQYERCLPDREEDIQKLPTQSTTSVSKNALLIDLNETYDNSMENTLKQPKPPSVNATKEGLYMTGKQSSVEFFPPSRFIQPYNVPSGFGISPLSRDNQSSSNQFSAPNQQSNQNSQRLGNVTTTMANQQNPSASSPRVLRACNTCHSGQQQQNSEATHHPTPPSSNARNPCSLNMHQKFLDHQSTNPDKPFSWDVDWVSSRPQKRWFKGYSKATYSNDSSIPALHLLSLMDPRLRPEIPIDQSRNTEIVKDPFSLVHQPNKVCIRPQAGDCHKTAYSTKQWPFESYSKRATTPETSRENFAIVSPVGTTSVSFQSGKGSLENANLAVQALWNQHEEKKYKRKDNNFSSIHNNSHLQKAIFTSSSSSSDPGKFRLLGASDSMMLPLKFHMIDNSKKQKTKKSQRNMAYFGPFECSVNRNPADFTIPDAPGNVYMIKGEDLKVKTHAGIKEKPGLCKQDALNQNTKAVAPATENA